MKRILITLFLTTILLAAACGGGSSDGDSGSSTGNANTSISTNACGVLGLNTRVINGTECDGLSSSPVVRILTAYQNGSVATCSGTMITGTEVLTAGHCILDFSDLNNIPVESVVVAGDVGSARAISVRSFAYHPGLRREPSGEEVNTFNDIAVLYLSEAAGVPTLPILTSTVPAVGEVVQIFGYGQSVTGPPATDSSFEELVNSQAYLRSGEMLLTFVSNNHLRADFLEQGSMICRGDSGGPLVYMYNGQPTIVGVASELVISGELNLNCDRGSTGQWTRLQSSEILNSLLELVPNAQTL